MLFGIVSFSGRLSRLGWFLNLIAFAVIIVAGAMAVDQLTSTSTNYLDDETRQQFIGIVALVSILALLSLIGASIRRMRDTGSKSALIATIIALAIPGFGWLYLLARLVFAGSAAPDVEEKLNKTSSRMAQEMRARQERHTKRASEKKQDNGEHSPDISEKFKSQVAMASNKRLSEAAARHHVHGKSSGPTVTWVRRALPVRARKMVAF